MLNLTPRPNMSLPPIRPLWWFSLVPVLVIKSLSHVSPTKTFTTISELTPPVIHDFLLGPSIKHEPA